MPSEAAGRRAARIGIISRPRLVARLDDGWPRRLTLLVAGAGYGKSTIVEAWLTGRPTAWVSLGPLDRSADALGRRVVDALITLDAATSNLDPPPARGDRPAGADDIEGVEHIAQAIAEWLGGAPRRNPTPPVAIVLDDVHELEGGTGAQLVAALVRELPASVAIVITTRTGLPFPVERLRPRRELLELDAADLAFDVVEIAEVAAASFDADADGLVSALGERTAGWPAAVRLLVEWLRHLPAAERSEAIAAAGSWQGSVFRYLAEEVLAREPSAVIELIRTVAPYAEVDGSLCARLGIPDAEATMRELERRGLFVAGAGGSGTFTVHRLVRDYAHQHLQLDVDLERAGRRAEAQWRIVRGEPERALRTATVAGDVELTRALLIAHGPALVASGRCDAVIEAVELTGTAAGDELSLIAGDARAFKGQLDDALACYGMPDADEPMIAGALAWRIARVHLERNEVGSARAVVDRGELGGTIDDHTLVLAYRALARFFGGDPSAAKVALEAVAIAERGGDPRARSVAHMAAAYALRADDPASASRHHRLALDAAIEADDVHQIVRLRAADDDAPSLGLQLERAHEILGLAEVTGSATQTARALVNRALVEMDLGLLEQAAADLARCREVSAVLGGGAMLIPAVFTAELGRIRGDVAQADSVLRSVITDADRAGRTDVAAYARASLARILARTDPPGARAIIGRALEDVEGSHRQDTLVAAAWVAACQGRNEDARRFAIDAIERSVDVPGRAAALASAIEALACAEREPSRRLGGLDEAHGVWTRIGNEQSAAINRLAASVLGSSATEGERPDVLRALEALGIRPAATEAAGLLAMLPVRPDAGVRIRVLGGFTVERDGHAIVLGEWRSRKARDVLKILVVRRHRPIPRDELMDILWPGEPPHVVASRMSVALSLLRATLDPGHRLSPDHFVSSGPEGIVLGTIGLSTDLDAFLSEARAGLAAVDRGTGAGGERMLASAEARYAGDLLPGDAYADWTVSAREEARGLHAQVSRTLARLASARGEHAGAARFLMRALETDPYDEPAHLELVRVLEAAGQRGEARRAYRTYIRRMAELEVEPTPYPG